MAVYDEKLCAFLEGIEKRCFQQSVYRFTAGSRDAQEPNRSGARWNPRYVPALYAALTREVAMAEHAWQLEVQSPRPTKGRFTLYQVRVAVEGVIDLRDQDLLGQLGLPDEVIADDNFSACQFVGGAAAYVKIGGLLVPSVRRTGSGNLVIFPSNHKSSIGFEIEASENIPVK